MKKFELLFMAIVGGLTLTGCQKEPDYADLDDEYRVYTQFDSEADFTKYSTFYVADSLLVVGDNPRGEYVKDVNSDKIVAAYVSNMESRGFVKTEDKDKADLGLQLTYITDTHYFIDYIDSPYWWWGYPGYWDPYYWGYGGYWGYSFPVYYSYDTNSLLAEIVDLTQPKDSTEREIPVLWNSYITGVSTGYAVFDMQYVNRGVNQSFAQSPSLSAGKE